MHYSPKKMKNLLEDNSFNFKKKFGQNFIIDENVINRIVENSKIDDETLVIEVGPGAGSLTEKLAIQAKQVICYEIDTTLKAILDNVLERYHNVTVIYQDFLKSNVMNDIQGLNYKKIYLIANLPYYVTTPIIMKVIDRKSVV